jgi:pilus assembly protein Flp/PilA
MHRVTHVHPVHVSQEATMSRLFVRFVREDEGQDLIEYAMLATVIALVVFAGASAAGNSLNDWYTNLSGTLTKWAGLASK